MTMLFRPAARQDSKPLIGLYGLSGSGKTMSALLLARGLVGSKGKIAMIDTESGRGSLYADVIPGGYDVLELGEPFSPARYAEAIDVAFKSGAGVLVIDSMSHEWESAGSVTDMAAEIERKTGKPGLHCWKEPKMQHTKLMLKLLQSPIPVIVCLRAKRKSRQVPDPEKPGKFKIVKDEFATPKQDGDFIFEMMAHAEVMPDHTLRVTKVSHPALAPIFATGVTVTVQTGEALAAWARGGAVKTLTDRLADRPKPTADEMRDGLMPHLQEDAAPESEATDPAVIQAEAWANEKIKWLSGARPDQAELALKKWKTKLSEVRTIAPDAASAVVAAAEMRMRSLTV